MRKRNLLFVLLCSWNLNLSATDGVLPGSGTDDDPFLLSDYLDLCAIADSGMDMVYRLVNNIDASASDTANGGEGFLTIGTYSDEFYGKIHGGGFSINNLYINRPGSEDVSFIGNLRGTGALIDSLNMINCNINGSRYVGGITANIEAGGIVTDCYVSGRVNTGSYEAGGITSYSSNAIIRNCVSEATVSGTLYIGGIGGHLYYTSIQGCRTTGYISGSHSIAGIVGEAIGTTVTDSYSTCKIPGYGYVGGIVGFANGSSSVNRCYYTGDLSGHQYLGGICGLSQGSSITDCYSTGTVLGNQSEAGGISGTAQGGDIIKNCYASGFVQAPFGNTNGIVGASSSNLVSYCYWNKETTTQNSGTNNTSDTLVFGLSTIQLKNSEFTDSLNYDTIWYIRQDSTYPALQSVNNAPFAFRDVITTGCRASIESVLANDYDYETLQQFLVFKFIRLYGIGETDSVNWFALPESAVAGTKDSIQYRVGEILPTGETLWGNLATAVFEKADNTAPNASNDPVSLNMNSTSTILASILYGNDTDDEGDYLTIDTLIFSTIKNGAADISGNSIVYAPNTDWAGTDSLMYVVTDGELSDTAWVIFTVHPGSISNDFRMDEITIYPNPFNDYVTIIVEPDKKGSYQLYSMHGSLVSRGVIDGTTELYFPEMEKGVYFLQIHLTDRSPIFKIVKQ
jgi:hypothetical protein